MASVRQQDLPPEGGLAIKKFRLLEFQLKNILEVSRIFFFYFLISLAFWKYCGKSCILGYSMIAGYFGVTTVGLYLYYLNAKVVKHNEIEMRSSRMALMPLLFAERDREYRNSYDEIVTRKPI